MNGGVGTRLSLIVTGRVQGVFFRAATVQQARMLGIRGYVRNRLDGSVEIVAEGSRGRLERLLAWAQVGPPRARVDEVGTNWNAATGEFRDFEIR